MTETRHPDSHISVATATIAIPQLDFADVDNSLVYTYGLIDRASDSGLFISGAGDPATKRAIRMEARAWIKEADQQLSHLTPGAALEVVHLYDLIHRIAYGQPAATDKITEYTLLALEAIIKGNKDVDPYTLYRRIALGLRSRNPRYYGRPQQWLELKQQRWLKDFRALYPSSKNPSSIPNSPSSIPNSPSLPLYDHLQRAAILLETDLSPYSTLDSATDLPAIRTLTLPFLTNLPSSPRESLALRTYLLATRTHKQ